MLWLVLNVICSLSAFSWLILSNRTQWRSNFNIFIRFLTPSLLSLHVCHVALGKVTRTVTAKLGEMRWGARLALGHLPRWLLGAWTSTALRGESLSRDWKQDKKGVYLSFQIKARPDLWSCFLTLTNLRNPSCIQRAFPTAEDCSQPGWPAELPPGREALKARERRDRGGQVRALVFILLPDPTQGPQLGASVGRADGNNSLFCVIFWMRGIWL